MTMVNLRTALLAEVKVSSLNSRKNLEAGSEDAGINDLASSIRVNGLLQPPTVREVANGGYEVIAGQRRILACQHLDWTHIDVLIVDLDDDQALSASLVENLQRADMDPLDKARGFQDLVQRTGSETEASRLTGVRLPTLRKYLLLLQLPEDLRDLAGTGEGPSGVGALSTLARTFEDQDEARQAWRMMHGFKGGTAEKLLHRSGGDLTELRELQQRQLDGDFNIERCGAHLATCPWVTDLPVPTQKAVLAAAKN